jgi:hypothetical protein
MSLHESRGGHSTSAARSAPHSRFTGRIIDTAKQSVSTLDFADLLCGPGGLRRIGKEWVGHCPIPDHPDKTPSFCVNAETGAWFCHGCLRGGPDAVRLACFMWGYAPRTKEEQGAAAQLLMEFGFPVPERPLSWYAKQRRQHDRRGEDGNRIAGARDELHRARFAAARRRCYKLLLRDLEAMGDPEPSDAEREMLWEAAARIANALLADREQREAGAA